MTDAAKVAALGEARLPWHVWTYRPSSGAQECGNCGMPFSELAYSDPDRFPCTALSASDSGEVAGLRADHAEGLTADMLAVEGAISEAMNRAQRVTRTLAALTRPVSETPEAPAGTVALCGTAVAPHWHVFGPDCDSVATYDTEAEARAALAAEVPQPAPAGTLIGVRTVADDGRMGVFPVYSNGEGVAQSTPTGDTAHDPPPDRVAPLAATPQPGGSPDREGLRGDFCRIAALAASGSEGGE